MYKITQLNNGFQYKEIPQGVNPQSIRGFTYEQIERLNCQNEDNVYFQENIPECETKYWKLDNDIVTEMTEEGKQQVDLQITSTNEFKDKKYKVHIGNIAKFLQTPYASYLNYCKEHPDIITEQWTEGSGEDQVLKGNAYLDYIKTADLQMINAAAYSDTGDSIFQKSDNPYYQ